MTQYVFVYGSLKRGKWNNDVLGQSELVEEVTTKEEFVLTDCGFPYLIPADALGDAGRGLTAPVEGELYAVTEDEVLESLDALEGVGYNHYEHRNVMVEDENGTTYEAVAYVPCDPKHAFRYELCSKTSKGNYVWQG